VCGQSQVSEFYTLHGTVLGNDKLGKPVELVLNEENVTGGVELKELKGPVPDWGHFLGHLQAEGVGARRV
jgi:hypothetical protein